MTFFILNYFLFYFYFKKNHNRVDPVPIRLLIGLLIGLYSNPPGRHEPDPLTRIAKPKKITEKSHRTANFSTIEVLF
jgi:hypothetical protein